MTIIVVALPIFFITAAACIIFALILTLLHYRHKIPRPLVLVTIVLYVISATSIGWLYISPMLLQKHSVSKNSSGSPSPDSTLLINRNLGDEKITLITRPDVVDGENILTGYQVGESVIYPGYSGYSVLANPDFNWTIKSKNEYVQNHQAERDLAIFRQSSYSVVAEREIIGYSATISHSANFRAGHYQFHSKHYFSVMGDPQGGFLGNDSTLSTQIGSAFATDLAYPYRDVGWSTSTEVYSLIDTTYQVVLSLSWRFDGAFYSINKPQGASPHGSTYIWSSGPQRSWYYAIIDPKYYIISSSLLPTQTRTIYSYEGTIFVKGGAYDSGGQRDGWGFGGILTSNNHTVIP